MGKSSLGSNITTPGLLYLVLRDIETHGVERQWYYADSGPRRDVLGYAKQHLGYNPDSPEFEMPGLWQFLGALGFPPNRDGAKMAVVWNDRATYESIVARVGSAYRRLTE
jgi:hypothetical protein